MPPGQAAAAGSPTTSAASERRWRRARQCRRLDRRDRGAGARRHPGHGFGLRHHGQGLRLHAADRPRLCGQGRAGVAAGARTSASILPGSSSCRGRPRRPRRRLSRRLLASAWTENCASSRKNCFPSSASWSKMCRKDICAAARPGPTTFFSRSLRGGCARARSANIEKLRPDVIAAGNIGCITQIAAGTAIPVVHTVELIDWATGGPSREAMKGKVVSAAARPSRRRCDGTG